MRTLNHLAGPTPRPHIAALLAAAFLALAAPVAFAAWMSINTNDGQIAGNLGAPLYSSACSDGTLANYLEIKNAWAVQDGSNFYFRLEACAQPAAGTEIQTLRIGAGFDCNNDGDVLDGFVTGPDGDRKLVYWPNADQVWIYSGSNQQIIQMPDNSYGERISATYDWRVPIDKIPPDCRASVLTIGRGFATAKMISGSPVNQDESPLTPFNHPVDYGDANNPDPLAVPPTCVEYPTRINCDGARHGTEGTLKLGALLDPDTGGVHTANADGDDLANLPDEDGVAPTAGVNWVNGGQGSLTATVAGGSGYLNCWIDWNNDKDWADADEKVVNAAPVAAGANTLAISVPAAAAPFPTSYIARCRLSPASGQGTSVTGAVEFGEVEDHKWAFGATGNRPAPVTLAASVLDPATVRLSWTNIPANEGYLVLSSAAPYFQPGDAGVTVTPASGSPYDVTGVLGPPADARFYAVQGQVTSSDPDLTSALSNRVGIFEFALVAGS